MNSASVPEKEKAWFFHLYQKSFIVDIVFIYHQTQMAIFRKEVRNRGVQESTESNEVKKCDFNNNVNFPAPGCVTIIRTPEIAFSFDNMGLVLKVLNQHGSELIFFEHSGQSPVNSRLCPIISKTVAP